MVTHGGYGVVEACLRTTYSQNMEYSMSVDSFVFLQDARLPTVAEWQHALDTLDTHITLGQVDDLRSHVGYLPACYRGHNTSFEWFFGPVTEIYGQVPEAIGERSHAIDFVTHSDMQELICGMIAGAVLAQLADGLVFDEESNSFIDGKRAFEIAKQVEASQL
jgi:hypothetical protein